MQKILIVEDDKKLREELRIFLNNNGYEALILEKFNNTIQDILNSNPDLILLDINLPNTDGEYICKELRKVSNVPIIIVTSRDNEIDELLSINYGADHYITKPFNIQILLAKISSLLRRANMSADNSELINANEFVLNISKSRIEKDEKTIELTNNEIKILKYLLKNRDRIVSRDEIMEYLWEDSSFVDDNTLTVNITRIRNKLTELNLKDLIETKRGQGYILKIMKFKEFIIDKILTISLLIFAIVTIEIFLFIYPAPMFIKIYIPISIFLLYFISLYVEFYKKNVFYSNLKKTLDDLSDKYLITEIISTPSFFDGKMLKEIIEITDKSMLENVNKYKFMQEDYKEYIELWIHEIKIPISTSKMIIENNKNDVTKSIDEEINKLDDYVEQALYYARSNDIEKDYFIKSNNLQEIVNESIKKNRTSLIQNKFIIDLHDLETNVKTDSKWIIFILNQIIQNSVKYRSANPKLEIYSKEGKEQTTLYIKDNGIGISSNEINRVFEKGFTGTNGRITNKKSTGIGLYLCKKLCDKLNVGLGLESKKEVGTEIKIVFPNSSFNDLR